MDTFNLINVFNGFIRNYENFNLNIGDKKEEIVKRENKFFIMLGQFLGFEVVSENRRNFFENKIVWIDKDNENSSFLTVVREDDLINDLQNIQNLVSYLKYKNDQNIINIVETSSEKRIEYLNNIILTSNLCIKKEILVIYINRDILNSRIYVTGNLYNGNELVLSKKAVISLKEKVFTGEFMVH